MGDNETCLQCHQDAFDKTQRSLAQEELIQARRRKEIDTAILASVLVTTEQHAPDLDIIARYGIISSEVVFGLHLIKDVAAAMRDTFGGRSKVLEEGLRTARLTAIEELKRQALEIGANAVVAVNLSFNEVAGGGKSMMFVVATGTAVSLRSL